MTSANKALIVVAHFVCPLLFFTNLTRNPYVSQIALLNISLALAAAAYLLAGVSGKDESLRLPRTPLDVPLAYFCFIALLSWGVAYVGHAAFFRPSMLSEGARAFLFLGVNCLIPFYLSAACPQEDGGKPGVELGPWVTFVVVWGVLWLAFPQARGRVAASADIWGQVWDGYGVLLWAGGLAAAFWLCRRGRAIDFLHLPLAVGFLASVYGVMQFFNFEIVWPTVLNPYGGRSVSTFGNPNFLSSYNVILFPIALAFFLQARSNGARIVYGVLTLALEAALLCSMTRSSWVGALLAALMLALSPELRRSAREQPRPAGLLAVLCLATALAWPSSSISSGYTPSVIGRLAEVGQAIKQEGPYSPWHQRLLIWTCAWLMGAENPISGKGFGNFELFYPFYQGHMLNTFDFVRPMRTHANNGHNEVMEVWAQMGLLGLGALFWLWTTFFSAVKKWRGNLEKDADLRLAACAGAAGMLVDNLLNVSLHFAVPGFLFWWIVGYTMHPGQYRPDGLRAAALPPLARKATVLCASLFLAYVSWTWVRVWNRETHYFAGFKMLRQGTMAAAVKQLEISRDWGPREVNALYELGNSYARTQQYPQAEAGFLHALRANAGYDEIYFNLGAILSGQSQAFERAVSYFEIAWWINPLSAEVYTSLSALYLRDPARYRSQAKEMLERAVHFHPANAGFWHNLGYLYAGEGRFEEAEKAYVQALTVAPDMSASEQSLQAVIEKSRRPRPPILTGLAELRALDGRLAKGDYSAASLAMALKAAERFPEMAKARFLAGSLLLVHKRASEAAIHLEWVAAHEPRHVAALNNLGTAYLTLGRSQEAVTAFKRALQSDPQNAQARERLKALGAL